MSFSADQNSMLSSLDALRQEVARLASRVAAVEATLGTQLAAKAAASQPPTPVPRISEETIAAVTAAVAAYLGVRPHIRQISLVGGTTWAQQGRVTIQASHYLPIRHE
jgi:methylmalonyl-CoA carboxyltransferase large subunit